MNIRDAIERILRKAVSVLARALMAGWAAFRAMSNDSWAWATLRDLPRPASPIVEPWELSIGTLICRHPKVPSVAARLLRRLDQFGRVMIGPDRIGFDDKTVRWAKVIEIRTYVAACPVPSVVVNREIDRIRELLPPVPGRKRILTKAVDGLMILMLAAAGSPERSAHSIRTLPCEIVYRNRLGRRATLPAGLFAAIILAAIPEAALSLTTTAQIRAIPVRAMTDDAGATRAERARKLRRKSARFRAATHIPRQA